MERQMLQMGHPRDVFGLPQTKDVAAFVSTENILEGSIIASERGVVTIALADKMIEAVSNLSLGEEVFVLISGSRSP